MLNIAICDDESVTCEYLSRLVLQCVPECKTDCFFNGKKLLDSTSNYDIALLDIQMDTLDGITAAEELRRRGAKTVIIFITGLRQHVFRAFDVGAFHYLLKPVDENKFRQVLLRAADECAAHKPSRHIFINTRKLHRTVDVKEIQYIESIRRKVIIYTKEETFELYATMEDLEAQLGSGFFRCHRGYLVNLAEISGYDRLNIRLKSGATLLLSKQKYSRFLQAYMHFLQNEGE